ncbi:MAG TPA: hypothetical protein VH088_11515 [Terriglobales bacterium]|jgi:hypothetical protein|nr:hypothetical protein [Terriglobales bacterium]
MQITNNHIPDEELLSFADGELESVRQAAAEKHLAACWTCRTRRAEIDGVIAEFVKISNQDLNSRIPSPSGPRTLLKLRLADAAKTQPGYLEQLQAAFSGWRVAYLGGAVFLLMLASLGLWRHRIRFAAKNVSAMGVIFEPNPVLTPGAVRPVSFTEICRAGTSDKNRTVPVALQQQVFQEYGIPNARPEDYEVDYLITPELGGADDIKNLWPQPFGAKNWSAYTKDDLEDRLHEMVCARKIELSTAQRDIASDWIGAYKKYVEADKPRADQPGTFERSEIPEIAGLSSMPPAQ